MIFFQEHWHEIHLIWAQSICTFNPKISSVAKCHGSHGATNISVEGKWPNTDFLWKQKWICLALCLPLSTFGHYCSIVALEHWSIMVLVNCTLLEHCKNFTFQRELLALLSSVYVHNITCFLELRLHCMFVCFLSELFLVSLIQW